MSVYCVLVNWNGFRDTIECLATLLPVLQGNAGVIVCDNDSSDRSLDRIAEWALEHSPEWELVALDQAAVLRGVKPQTGKLYVIQNGANLGFAGGNNVGVRLALNDLACRYVWLLNNDTAVDANSLPAAVARMEEDATIGICGSTLLYHHNQQMVQALGGATYNRFSGKSRHIGAFAPLSAVPTDPAAAEKSMSYVVGAAMLVRREFIEQVGLMREDYFLYCEEIDWATRGQGRFRLGYAPESVVFHKEGATIGTSARGGSPLSVFYLFRNRLRYAWRFHRLFVPSVLFFCAVDVTKLALRRRWSQAFAALCGVLQFSPPVPVAKPR